MAGDMVYPRIRDLADIEEIEKIPFEDRLEHHNTYDLIQAGVAKDPDKVAIYFHPHGEPDETPERVTFAQLRGRINQAANLFHDLGVGPEDRVSYLLPNFPDLHTVIWGSQAAGITAPVNWMLEADHIAAIIRSVAPKVLVALGPTPGFDIWDKVQAIKGDIPSVEHILRISLYGEDDSAQSFTRAMEKYPGDKLTFNRAISLDDIAALMHTGGTTGAPKITQNTHRGLLYQAWAGAMGSAYRHDDTRWEAGPSFHIPIVTGGGLTPLAQGMTTVNPGPLGFRHKAMMRNYWKLMARYNITRLYGVPTILIALANVPAGDTDFSGLRFSISSSSPLPLEVSHQLERITGQRMALIYGLTETSASITCHPRDGEIRHGSCGLRRPYTHIRAVVLDAGGNIERDCRADEIGQFVVKGPGLIPGYWDSAFDAAAFTEDGWFKTGDLGRIEADGYIWVTGRTKDLIIRGGHNIDPRLIEEPLYEHPAVALAGAVGKPDAYAGELPVAYVQLKPGAAASADELREFARQRIGERAARPTDIFIIDALPLTGVEKVVKQELRHDAAERTFSALLSDLVDDGIGIKVSVGPDAIHGVIARVDLSGPAAMQAATEERVRQALSAFTMKHEIRWT